MTTWELSNTELMRAIQVRMANALMRRRQVEMRWGRRPPAYVMCRLPLADRAAFSHCPIVDVDYRELQRMPSASKKER